MPGALIVCTCRAVSPAAFLGIGPSVQRLACRMTASRGQRRTIPNGNLKKIQCFQGGLGVSRAAANIAVADGVGLGKSILVNALSGQPTIYPNIDFIGFFGLLANRFAARSGVL